MNEPEDFSDRIFKRLFLAIQASANESDFLGMTQAEFIDAVDLAMGQVDSCLEHMERHDTTTGKELLARRWINDEKISA